MITELFRLESVPLVQEVSGVYTFLFLDKGSLKKWLCGPEKFPRCSTNRPQHTSYLAIWSPVDFGSIC